ncbi:MAG: hypothetical protein GDA56_02050 [Hormoscilla sp. GM7CHS1pb]|nr:hypothetical protein [Hormoscilla sp. GM7CHS1pb]
MKRSIQCLAVLLFAFAVTFGFQVNAASADQTCQVNVAQPCTETIGNGETLTARFSNLSDINVVYQEVSGKPGVVIPVVGSQQYPTINLQPFGIVPESYPTVGITGAVFTNQSATQGNEITITITGNV